MYQVTTIATMDTKDRDTTLYPSSTNCKLNLPRGNRKPDMFEIVSVTIPFVWKTTDSTNNKFLIGATTYTLAEGHYNINGLITSLNTLISGVGTFSYLNNNVLQLTLSIAATFTPSIASNLLGFNDVVYPSATTFVGSYVPNLVEDSDYLTFGSYALSKASIENHEHSDNRSGALFKIPVEQEFGSIFTFKPVQRLQISNKNGVESIDVFLKDQGNNFIDIGKSSFSFEIIMSNRI